MKSIKKIIYSSIFKNNLNIGNKFFLVGILFLPSALPIGAFFLLLSLIISFLSTKDKLLKNKWNFLFSIWIFGVILSSTYNTFISPPKALLEIDKFLVWINLFNWIPIFFAYLGFQQYLKSEKQIILFIKFLISGTIPVIASAIMQKYFNIYGPLETLFGTVVWFNYENFNVLPPFRVTGLFNNPNYLGIWLVMCLPFSLAATKLKNNNFNQIIVYLINLLIVYFAVLTLSRNAILGIIISFFIVLDKKKLIYFSIFLFTSFLIFSYVLPAILDIEFAKIINFSPFERLSKISSLNLNSNNPRLNIWKESINLISQRPLLGWGAGTFPYLPIYLGPYYKETYQHTHNLLFELAYSFGIPLTFLIGSTTTRMLFLGFKKIIIFNKVFSNNLIYKPFLAAILIFLVTHMSDITYFDGKISILFAVLLAGLKNIIEKKDSLYYKNTLP